ncbi:P-loop containing nucleoside triphosphate hydrolase protein [Russula earlei]|uniref:P-loop containing nucleoside triphosphate hydrolase protein n=1 Tax=Russula earlei TaxID=71964 RepID=A0ACC0TUR5_9AGAM|nr:P-loop containing nucleoside triphosphate hydrolase protein [Russula earlei]
MSSSTALEVVDAQATTNTIPDSPFPHLPDASSSHLFPNETSIPHESDVYSPPAPSIRLLFSLLSRRDISLFLLPAFILSVVAGGVAPFMTLVLGNVFDTFAKFCRIQSPSPEDRSTLKHEIAISALELLALAAGALALSSLTSFLWILTGERNSMTIRQKVHASVSNREMAWFDNKMGTADGTQTEGDGSSGAGGLMAKFASETEEVRMASSLASGLLVQHITTCITCLVLGFLRSWALTLVILSVVPAIVILQIVSQNLAGPLLAVERNQLGLAATLVERAVSAIATVKAFNAISYEHSAFLSVTRKLQKTAWQVNRVWAISSAFNQFVALGMFVQGFWFGAKLVREGKVEAGNVMAVFWACLIATTNFQMCIPHLITLTKGKFAISALIALMEAPTPGHPNGHLERRPSVSLSIRNQRKAGTLRKIVPSKCAGEINLHEVTFAYPSRASFPVLKDVTIYIPPSETTFIVGGSGSGKSTIAQLLLRMYDIQAGTISLDEQDVEYLDTNWTRQQVGAVTQGAILFDMSVHENVAMGLAGPGSKRRPQDATREEVIQACRTALLHRFIEDLPDGYDTRLGNGGANLSGGQRQRLAIARAILRDPTVLILDEATSALDATSRILVFEAVKRWRRNRTTIVITHDLSQITPTDFAYVLKAGRVVECGYRADLEVAGGEFQQMAMTQAEAGGFAVKDEDEWSSAAVRRRDEGAEKILESQREQSPSMQAVRRESMAIRPITLGNWMFDVVSDLTRSAAAALPSAVVAERDATHVSRLVPMEAFTGELPPVPRQRRPSTLAIDIPFPSPVHTVPSRRFSLQFSPTVPDEKLIRKITTSSHRQVHDASSKRERKRWDTVKVELLNDQTMKTVTVEQPTEENAPQESFLSIVRAAYPTMPYKPLIALGIVFAIISGSITPLFSFMISRLLFEVSKGAQDVSVINTFGGIVLAIAIADGLFVGLKFIVFETAAMLWVTRLRTICYRLVLAQDKRWFDRSENAAVKLCQILTRDGDDARSLISAVFAQGIVVISMLSVGLIWALVRGWQLTLVGFAIAPVFILTMTVQSQLVAKCELRNKRAREEVAKGYYDTVVNIRGIRAMGFESVFRERFNESAENAMRTGVRGAFVEGCTYGVASSLIYLSEALLFYAGAVLVSKGTYSYLQMVQVLNLVVFTVSIGSQLMAFTHRIVKSVQATRDFNRLVNLTTDTHESHGSACPPISGTISFNNVSFAYPERPDVPVLKNLSLDINEGESVAVVGSSGSGKSTVAYLLQRLYEPSSGTITVGPWSLNGMDVRHLRDHVAVVSQNPHLFDATVSENIAYGTDGLPHTDIEHAALLANVHEFVESLPQGYNTLVGENAALISGGQAQRLQIARALVRPANVLILDECTSALDGANQAAVLTTVLGAKAGRTTIMITHKLPVMRMCDRILVMHEGKIAEQGTYDELIAQKGVFAQLASGGEWSSE